jgi:hypothetical protein
VPPKALKVNDDISNKVPCSLNGLRVGTDREQSSFNNNDGKNMLTKKRVTSIGQLPSNFFGAPPLLPGEDPAAYDDLLARVSRAIKPADIIEEVWVRDVVNLTWEVQRLRQLKAKLLAVNVHKGLEDILERMTDFLKAQDLGKGWLKRNSDRIKKVEDLLTSAELNIEDVMAQTLALELDDIERIDRMTMNLEARRNSALREIDRHRASVAQALRRAVNDIEDVQFEEVGAKQIADRNAA